MNRRRGASGAARSTRNALLRLSASVRVSNPTLDVVGDAGSLIFDLFAAVAFTLVGLEAELYGLQTFDGNVALAAWTSYMGALALYAGLVVFGGERLLLRLRSVDASR